MKHLFLLFFTAMSVSFANASDYKIDPYHSNMGFKIRHLVSKVNGNFTSFEGKFSYDPKSADQSTFEGMIQTKSINTSNPKRDKHLASPDFFDVAKYPKITFKSTKVKSRGAGRLEVMGDFTMRGITKSITLDVETTGEIKDPWGKEKLGLTATGKINRKDYGIVWNQTLDQGGVMLGEEVELILEVQAEKLVPAKEKTPEAPKKKKAKS